MFLNLLIAVFHAPIETWVHQMSLQEKISLCAGGDSMTLRTITRLGIPSWKMSDGPHGVRQDVSTGFPTGVCLASTWNPDLANEEGTVLGEESRATGNGVLLGPAINIDRTPLGGRDFEYMSEDPFLVSKMVVPYITGVQKNVAACVKHYACNSQEYQRDFINANISERALREIYLPGFEAAVKEGHVASVMAAYNKVNGLWCTENPHLETDILKKDWGFKGAIMSDWGATHHTVPAALAGLDLEMPGPGRYFGADLYQAVKDKIVPESLIDEKVTRILKAMEIGHVFDPPKYKPAKNTSEHQKTAQRVAEEGIVLLKNDKGVLPLNRKSLKRVAVIGPAADFKFCGGGGSSAVNTPHEITGLAGLKASLGRNVKVNYVEGVSYPGMDMDVLPATSLNALKAEYFPNMTLSGEPQYTENLTNIDKRWGFGGPRHGIPSDHFSMRVTGKFVAPVTGQIVLALKSDDGSRLYLDGKLVIDNWGDHGTQLARTTLDVTQGQEFDLKLEYYENEGTAECQLLEKLPGKPSEDPVQVAQNSDAAILFVGTNHEYDTEGSDKPNMHLMSGQDELIQKVCAVNPRTIVVLINGSPLDVREWVDKVPSIVEAWYPGQEGGTAIARVLLGDVNPSGKLPVTFPVRLEDSSAHANQNYPGSAGQLNYDEGILVGYRWFDTQRVRPMFPFGHGLSYTNFEYSGLSVDKRGHQLRVSFQVKNTGERSGAEVAQLYIHQPSTHTVTREEQSLKGFKKLYLKPGESRKVTILVSERDQSYYSEAKKGWVFQEDPVEVRVGSSSQDIRLKSAP